MWSSYFYKLVQNWTTPLYYLPRWFDENADQSLFDDIPIPPISSPVDNSTIPGSALLPFFSAAPNSSGILPILFESLINEKQQFQSIIQAISLQNLGYYDLSQPSFLWVLYYSNPVSSLTINTVSGSINIRAATDLLDLFNSADWRYYQQGNVIALFGLDLVEQTTAPGINNWQYLTYYKYWDGFSSLFIEHPYTKNWFPIPASSVRSDGFLGYISDKPLRVRTRNYDLATNLNSVVLTINGLPQIATRSDTWNSVDEKGMFFNVSRRQGESNLALSNSILLSSWFGGNDIDGVRSYISASLRTGNLISVPASSNSFTLPSNTGYKVKNINRKIYVTEDPVNNDPNSLDLFISTYNNPSFGSAYLNTKFVDFSIIASSNLIDLNTHVINVVNKPRIDWVLNYWNYDSQTGIFQFTDNFPRNVPDILVYCSDNVSIPSPSVSVLIKSYNDNSPIFKWRNMVESDDSINNQEGLANFL